MSAITKSKREYDGPQNPESPKRARISRGRSSIEKLCE